MPLDERFAFNTRGTFQRDTNVFLKENLLYQPNEKLMREIALKEGASSTTLFDNRTQQSPSKRGVTSAKRSASRGKDNRDDNNMDPIEYQISPDKMNGIRKNVLSIKMRSDEGSPSSSYQTSPEKSMQNSKGPQNGTTFGNNQLQQAFLMDEQCRKDLPPAPLTAGFPISTEARRLNESPQKSVRFTEDEGEDESKVDPKKVSKSGSSKKKRRQ